MFTIPDEIMKHNKLSPVAKLTYSILREFNSEKEAREFEQKVHKGFEECKISSEEARTFTDGTSVSRSKYGSKVRKSGVTEWFKIPLKYYCLIGDPVSYYLYEKGVYDYKTRT